MPDEVREKFNQAFANDQKGTLATLDEIRFNIYKKEYEKAQRLMETLVKEADENPMFRDDEVSAYFTFEEPFEEMLYLYLFKPEKKARRAEYPFAEIYLQQGSLFFELKRYTDAIEVLKKAVKWNPCNARIAFEYAEAYKAIGDLDEFLKITMKTFKIAFRPKEFARALRNVGFYLVEREKYVDAANLMILSLQYDRENVNAQSELYYISSKIDGGLKDPSWEDIEETGRKYEVPVFPDKDIIGIALAYGQEFLKNNIKDTAQYCFQIAYDLTEDDSIKELLDSVAD